MNLAKALRSKYLSGETHIKRNTPDWSHAMPEGLCSNICECCILRGLGTNQACDSVKVHRGNGEQLIVWGNGDTLRSK